jgi:hypothetical protein
MLPLGMVMRNIFAQGPPQGALTNENDLRQTLLLDRSHPALSVGVQVRASCRLPAHPRLAETFLTPISFLTDD